MGAPFLLSLGLLLSVHAQGEKAPPEPARTGDESMLEFAVDLPDANPCADENEGWVAPKLYRSFRNDKLPETLKAAGPELQRHVREARKGELAKNARKPPVKALIRAGYASGFAKDHAKELRAATGSDDPASVVSKLAGYTLYSGGDILVVFFCGASMGQRPQDILTHELVHAELYAMEALGVPEKRRGYKDHPPDVYPEREGDYPEDGSGFYQRKQRLDSLLK